MKGWQCLCLFWAVTTACPSADGSSQAPFFVDASSAVSPGTGSSCAPFVSMNETLLQSVHQSSVVISVQSSVSLPPWEVRNSLTLQANLNQVVLTGTVQVYGHLQISEASLTSTSVKGVALNVTGTLVLDHCSVVDCASSVINVLGQVTVTNSVFEGNSQGVFSIVQLGSSLLVSDSKFHSNAGETGAVFFVYPVAGSASTSVLVTDCEFLSNGVKEGYSVLSLNDFGVEETPLAAQTFTFSKCQFSNNRVTPLKVAVQLFSLVVESCSFVLETQVLTGSLTGGPLLMSGCSVSRSSGPVVALSMAGTLNITETEFAHIKPGPALYVTGKGTAVSVVYFSHVSISYSDNPGGIVYANLLNSVNTAIWMNHVRVSHFTARSSGIFYLATSIMYSNDLVFLNGSCTQTVFGEISSSTLVMNNTVYDSVNSEGTMAYLALSRVTFTNATYRNIRGFWNPILTVYTTNFFSCIRGSTRLDGVKAELAVPGTTLFYLKACDLWVTNGDLAGPLGMGVVTCVEDSSARLSNTTFRFTMGRTIAKMPFQGYVEFDLLHLQDLTLELPIISISSASRCYIRSLVLRNVTTLGLVKGHNSQVTIASVHITESSVQALVLTSLSV